MLTSNIKSEGCSSQITFGGWNGLDLIWRVFSKTLAKTFIIIHINFKKLNLAVTKHINKTLAVREDFKKITVK